MVSLNQSTNVAKERSLVEIWNYLERKTIALQTSKASKMNIKKRRLLQAEIDKLLPVCRQAGKCYGRRWKNASV